MKSTPHNLGITSASAGLDIFASYSDVKSMSKKKKRKRKKQTGMPFKSGHCVTCYFMRCAQMYLFFWFSAPLSISFKVDESCFMLTEGARHLSFYRHHLSQTNCSTKLIRLCVYDGMPKTTTTLS